MKCWVRFSFFTASAFFSIAVSFAQEKPTNSAEELAKKLANPVSSLISLPFQNNTDYGIGTLKGSRNTMNVQTVSLTAGPRIPIVAPDHIRAAFGWRMAVTFVFPK